MHVIRVGKRGIHKGIVEEIRREIKDKKVVKVKFSKSISRNKEEFERMLRELMRRLEGVVLIKKVGHTVVLGKFYKKKGRDEIHADSL